MAQDEIGCILLMIQILLWIPDHTRILCCQEMAAALSSFYASLFSMEVEIFDCF